MNQAILKNTLAKPPLTSASRAMAMLEINTHLAKLSHLPANHPDAGLILICQQHPRNIDAFNADPEDSGPQNPRWVEYERTLHAIDDAHPLTVAGKVAKALAAKAEALQKDGSEDPVNCPAETWAWDLVNDLIRENATPNPDAELITLSDRVVALQEQIDAFYSKGATPIEDDEERDVVIAPFSEQQVEVMKRMSELRATTKAGFAARARAIKAWEPEVLTRPSGYGDLLVAGLVEDLLACDLVRIAGGAA